MDLKVERPTRKYEAVIILNPDADEKSQKELFKKNANIIKEYSGQVEFVDIWGKRRLLNPIKKYKVGTFFHTMFEAKGDAINELERTMRINENVLRFAHTRLDDRKTLGKHLEDYRNVISASNKREQEREEKFQARKQRRERT